MVKKILCVSIVAGLLLLSLGQSLGKIYSSKSKIIKDTSLSTMERIGWRKQTLDFTYLDRLDELIGKNTILGFSSVIYIDGDKDFKSQAGDNNWPGDGTEENPYIIEGYDIDASGKDCGIYIGNTTVYFVIKNCAIYNAGKYNIYFYNVINGAVRNCNAHNSLYGVCLKQSSNNNISSNHLYSIHADADGSHGYPIVLVDRSNENVMSLNEINDSTYGIYLGESNRNIISTNTIHNNHNPNLGNGRAIYVYYNSNNNIVKSNIIYHNDGGIAIGYGSARNIVDSNEIYSNGEGILLWESGKNNVITSNDIYRHSYARGCSGIFSYSCSNNNISLNNIYNNSYGICFLEVSNTTVESNKVYNNLDFGIYLCSSHNNILISNEVHHTGEEGFLEEGICLYNSSNNIIISNKIYKNSYGICLEKSSNNVIASNSRKGPQEIYDNLYSLRLTASSLNSITNNQIYSNRYGIYLKKSSDNSIVSNEIKGESFSWPYYNIGIWLVGSSNNNTLSSNYIYNDFDKGIFLDRSSDNTITSNNIHTNKHGIYLEDSKKNEIHYNNISNNVAYGVYNKNIGSAYIVNATLNFWGDKSGPHHPTLNPNGKGDKVSNNVMFDPWLGEEESPPPTIKIIRPGNYIYLFDRELIPSQTSIIIGKITLKVGVSSTIGIEKVEFYIDNNLKFSDATRPYEWMWNELSIGKHSIKVIAYDIKGQKATDEINVFKVF